MHVSLGIPSSPWFFFCLFFWFFAQVRGQHYDLVLNGVEIGGGSVRVHDAHMQDYIFSKILQVRIQFLCIFLSLKTPGIFVNAVSFQSALPLSPFCP